MPGQPGLERLCEWCGDEIPARMRRDSVYCSRDHKNAARRARKRTGTLGVTTGRSGIPLDSREWESDGYAGEPDGYPDEEAGSPSVMQRIASTRFHRILREQEAKDRPAIPVALSQAQKRNPGVVLPAIKEISSQAMPVPEVPELREPTLAERARASRAGNRPRSWERRPSAEFPDITTWATLPAPTRNGPERALGRRMPARYLNIPG